MMGSKRGQRVDGGLVVSVRLSAEMHKRLMVLDKILVERGLIVPNLSRGRGKNDPAPTAGLMRLTVFAGIEKLERELALLKKAKGGRG